MYVGEGAPPILYRHMQAHWVREFWDRGTLKIGSFFTNATLPSEALRDREARTYFAGSAGNVGVKVIGYGADQTHYRSFSTSSLCTPEVAGKLGADDYFVIHDPIGFGNHIAEIIGARSWMLGPSLYGTRVFGGEIEEPVPYYGASGRPTRDETQAAGLEIYDYLRRQFWRQSYFSKVAEDAWQSEYRFLWNLGTPVCCYIYPAVTDRELYCRRSD